MFLCCPRAPCERCSVCGFALASLPFFLLCDRDMRELAAVVCVSKLVPWSSSADGAMPLPKVILPLCRIASFFLERDSGSDRDATIVFLEWVDFSPPVCSSWRH